MATSTTELTHPTYFCSLAALVFREKCASLRSAQPDFAEWKKNLHVYGLDLRDVAGVEAFASFIKVNYVRVDILINNACQTIRRPAGYYKDVVETEKKIYEGLVDTGSVGLLTNGVRYDSVRHRMKENERGGGGGGGGLQLTGEEGAITTKVEVEAEAEVGVSHSAKMSQMVLLPEDVGVDER